MEHLLRRYIDGELSPQEADELLLELDRDPVLKRHLRRSERLLASIERLPPPSVPSGFAQRVMESVSSTSGVRTPISLVLPRVGRLFAFAASVVLVFAAGWWVARSGESGPSDRPSRDFPGAPLALSPPGGATPVPGQEDRVLVRFVHVPSAAEVQSVSVAGSFNDWVPHPMQPAKSGRTWSAILILPRDEYEYMFVEDGQRWLSDPLATQLREDGFGGRNAVLDLRI